MMSMHSQPLFSIVKKVTHPPPRSGDSPDCDIECVAAPLDMGYGARIDLRSPEAPGERVPGDSRAALSWHARSRRRHSLAGRP